MHLIEENQTRCTHLEEQCMHWVAAICCQVQANVRTACLHSNQDIGLPRKNSCCVHQEGVEPKTRSSSDASRQSSVSRTLACDAAAGATRPPGGPASGFLGAFLEISKNQHVSNTHITSCHIPHVRCPTRHVCALGRCMRLHGCVYVKWPSGAQSQAWESWASGDRARVFMGVVEGQCTVM